VQFDYDLDKAKQTRERMFDMLAHDRVALLGAHVKAPGLGYILRRGTRLRL
jgi:hypothetical protein